jgi:hypothetical protein
VSTAHEDLGYELAAEICANAAGAGARCFAHAFSQVNIFRAHSATSLLLFLMSPLKKPHTIQRVFSGIRH